MSRHVPRVKRPRLPSAGSLAPKLVNYDAKKAYGNASNGCTRTSSLAFNRKTCADAAQGAHDLKCHTLPLGDGIPNLDTSSRMPTHPVRAPTPTAPKAPPMVGERKTAPSGIARLIPQMRLLPKAPTFGVAKVRKSRMVSATRSLLNGSCVEPPQLEAALQPAQAATPRSDSGMSQWFPTITSNGKSAVSPSSVDPMWSPAATSGAATNDGLQPMCLDELLSQEANCRLSPHYRCNDDHTDGEGIECWALPIIGDLSSREVLCVAHNDADSYALPLLPLESVERGVVLSLMDHTRVCRAILGLAKIDGSPPFQQQSFPLQHQTMVCSMQPNPPLMPSNREHGRATTEQT